jgi:hypothetical protein
MVELAYRYKMTQKIMFNQWLIFLSMIKGVKLKGNLKKKKREKLLACWWGKKVDKKIFLKGIYKIVFHPSQNINKS